MEELLAIFCDVDDFCRDYEDYCQHHLLMEKSQIIPKTYILYVKCRGETVITPPLRGNPERVLKSTKCRVYCYEGQKYVTDFDERFFRIGKGVSIPKI